MKKGFTLIELMIAITIIGVLVSMGLSAYGRGRDRQYGVIASEQIISYLQEQQSIANTGKKDCAGKYLGQQVNISTPNTFTSQSICEGNNGIMSSMTVPNIAINSGTTLVFNPLSKGIEIAGSISQFTLTYLSSANLTYSITIVNSGTIEYLGLQ